MKFSVYTAVNESIIDSLKLAVPLIEERTKDIDCEILLFGSCARGKANGGSDIDIAIIVNQEIPLSVRHLASLLVDTGVGFDICIYSHHDFYTYDDDIYKCIKKDGLKWEQCLMYISH